MDRYYGAWFAQVWWQETCVYSIPVKQITHCWWQQSRSYNTVRKIADDPEDKNILWLACMDGLYRFDKNAGRLTQFENTKQGTKSWKDNCFHAISCKNEKVIWLGTWGGGVVSFDRITRSSLVIILTTTRITCWTIYQLTLSLIFILYPIRHCMWLQAIMVCSNGTLLPINFIRLSCPRPVPMNRQVKR